MQARRIIRGGLLVQMKTALRLAVVGAGPSGLALALLAARSLQLASITVFDARPADKDVAQDPRTLALALGSVQLLQRLSAWPTALAQPILDVHVSQAPPSHPAAEVHLRATDEGVPMLGAVLSYGALVSALQQAWIDEAAREPQRLALRLGTPVAAVLPAAEGVSLDTGSVETFDVAVIAEGGVFAEQSRKAWRHDYAQTAWVGTATLHGAPAATAFERFTRAGPLALLPLPAQAGTPPDTSRAAIVWCVARDDDPVQSLDEAERLVLVQSLLPEIAGRITALSALKPFALGLNAERSLVQGRCVRIGNAAQTLHPVAGQGLNLGLRDAHELVQRLRDERDVERALAGFDRARALDRWSTLVSTDLLARGFAWRAPLLAPLRALGLAGFEAATPLKSMLARQMMFGRR